jgi:hypothetical protein
VILLVLVASVSSETLTCRFEFSLNNEYTCRFLDIMVTDPSVNIVFSGQHLPGQTNANVKIVRIDASNTPFIIPEMFTTFPTLAELYISNSNLQSISFPSAAQLQRFESLNNNIERIVNGTFAGQKTLWLVDISNSRVKVVEPEAFTGAERLTMITLVQNEISSISPSTFKSLKFLSSVDLQINQLTTIECGLFEENQMQLVNFGHNQIHSVCPTFTQEFSIPRIFYIGLHSNKCISRSSYMSDQLDLVALNNALTSCFNNFVGGKPEVRRVTLEFRGPISLYDEFGNIIAKVD